MFLGWRRFGKEMPKTERPMAYFNGKLGRLYECPEWGWTLSFYENGERVRVPAFHFLDILFMDDLRGRKVA